MEFNAVHIPAGNNGINALRIIDTETSAFQRGKGTTLAYWVPQGGYADIPAHPENGQPQLVFTPGSAGARLLLINWMIRLSGYDMFREVKKMPSITDYMRLSMGME